jgi:uncharacterized protein (TIGR01777 family)
VKVALTGATGLIGGHLARALIARGDEVVALVRGDGSGIEAARDVHWDPAEGPLPAGALDGVDAVVNLAGASIGAKRWTAARKRLIRESRVLTTRAVVDALAADGAPRVLVNASGIDIYGAREDPVDEGSGPGQGFLPDTAVAWEREAMRAADHGVRVVLVRSGLVLAPEAEALIRMARPVKLFAGGPLGSGRQWYSWIHIDDEVGLFLHALDHPEVSGPLNAVSPSPQRQREFVRVLAGVLNRPALLPAPAAAVRLAVGELATLALDGRPVMPRVAEETGYAFRYPDLEPALRQIYA